MASDQQVNARIVMQSLLEVQRQGQDRVLQDLEKIEPDLAELIMESLGQIHQRLLEVGATSKQTLQLRRQVEQLVLVVITALRKSHYELWRQAAAGTPLAQLDPSLGGADVKPQERNDPPPESG